MKNLITKLLVAALMLLIITSSIANNIQVTNVMVTGQRTTEGYTLVMFDLSWEHSWRTNDLNGDGETNWDAAWVFAKYRISAANGGDDLWKHVSLHNTGHNGGTGTGAIIDAGLLIPGNPFHAATNPALGVFIYRQANGTGTFSLSGAQLRWNYQADTVADNAVVDVRVFAIEMVYVAQGDFWVGTPDDEMDVFTVANDVTAPYTPFLITSTPPMLQQIDPASSPNNLSMSYGLPDNLTGSDTLPLVDGFPTGYEGFYCQKYEIAQQQYVDFLNTLTQIQANKRKHTYGSARYAITGSTVGSYTTTNPYVACNYLSWMDGAAYADWAGLRPMTELEYEKACRGPRTPISGEYAMGTWAKFVFYIVNPGEIDESIPPGSNSNIVCENKIGGPMRVGVFATDSSTRSLAGASYWGIMELSGNLREHAVSVGLVAGHSFTGLHGNGYLNVAGDADVDYWPGINHNQANYLPSEPYGGVNGVTQAAGAGLQGGSWYKQTNWQTVSRRYEVINQPVHRRDLFGFRCVRSLP